MVRYVIKVRSGTIQFGEYGVIRYGKKGPIPSGKYDAIRYGKNGAFSTVR